MDGEVWRQVLRNFSREGFHVDEVDPLPNKEGILDGGFEKLHCRHRNPS